jgi:2-oxoisovalerate dehydrogenase E1 component
LSGDPLARFPDELERALTIRLTEQRLLRLFAEGRLFGTVHTCIGQEFVGVAVSRALKPQDTLFSNHRCHGHFLAYCNNVVGLVGEVMGKTVGVCGGRGGSQHLHQDGFYSNGILGGTTPVSTGLAFAHKLKKTGGIAVAFIGDGTLGQGVLYESMNLASKWDLPILFVQENNGYAQSTNQTQTLAGDICARAEAFGIISAHSDTWDWRTLLDDVAESVRYVREEGRPRFHRVDTFRLMAHSKGDDNRSDEEVEPYRQRDPINKLLEQHADDPRWKEMLERIEARIEAAVVEARHSDRWTIPPDCRPLETTAGASAASRGNGSWSPCGGAWTRRWLCGPR